MFSQVVYSTPAMSFTEAADWFEKVGQKLGVEVREVGTVFDAYEALTGHALPRPTAGSTPQMPPRAFDRMRAKTLEWISRYQKSRSEFNALPQQVQDLIADYAAQADAKAADADKMLKQGLVAVAYSNASEAAIYAQLATMTGQIVQTYLIGGLQKAIEHYQASSAAQTELKAVIATLKAEDAKTVSDVLALFEQDFSLVDLALSLRNLGVLRPSQEVRILRLDRSCR